METHNVTEARGCKPLLGCRYVFLKFGQLVQGGGGQGRQGLEIYVLGNPDALFQEGCHVSVDSLFGPAQVMVIQIHIQQINIPGRFDICHHIGVYNLSGDGQGRFL